MRISHYPASNDYLIEAIIQDPRYQIKPDGSIFRLNGGGDRMETNG